MNTDKAMDPTILRRLEWKTSPIRKKKTNTWSKAILTNYIFRTLLMFASSYLFYSWVKEICKSWHKNKHKLCERKTHTYDKGNGEANSHTQNTQTHSVGAFTWRQVVFYANCWSNQWTRVCWLWRRLIDVYVLHSTYPLFQQPSSAPQLRLNASKSCSWPHTHLDRCLISWFLIIDTILGHCLGPLQI